jgi:hypothetical protein
MCAYLDHDDRRFAVLNCMDTHANDKAYWRKVAGFIATGGREGFLHYLLYNQRAAVDAATNKGRTPLSYIPMVMDADRWDMKLLSGKPVFKWLFNALSMRDSDLVRYVSAHTPTKCTMYPLVLSKKKLYSCFSEDCQDKGKQYVDETTFVNDFLKFVSSGRHSKQGYILRSYNAFEAGCMGVKGGSVSACIRRLRCGFMQCSKLDVDRNYDDYFGDLADDLSHLPLEAQQRIDELGHEEDLENEAEYL